MRSLHLIKHYIEDGIKQQIMFSEGSAKATTFLSAPSLESYKLNGA